LYNFITIEGCIGAGKTTLSIMLANAWDAPCFFENFEDNPYLKSFYEDPEKNAFPLELYFMAERFQQQKKLLEERNLFTQQVVSDYAFFKSLVFANITLKNDELQLYKMLFHIMYPNIKSPDIILYLHKPIELLLQNIKNRGREYEANITGEYLEKLHQTYMDFFKQQENSKIIILDTSQIDFVKNKEDFTYIVSLFTKNYDKKIIYL
jgi:deoxyguanosine kinase